jgi:hypothetical protein
VNIVPSERGDLQQLDHVFLEDHRLSTVIVAGCKRIPDVLTPTDVLLGGLPLQLG